MGLGVVKRRHWFLLTTNSVTCALMDKMISGTLSLSITPMWVTDPCFSQKAISGIPTLSLPAHHLHLRKLSLQGSLHCPVKIKMSKFFAQLTVLWRTAQSFDLLLLCIKAWWGLWRCHLDLTLSWSFVLLSVFLILKMELTFRIYYWMQLCRK